MYKSTTFLWGGYLIFIFLRKKIKKEAVAEKKKLLQKSLKQSIAKFISF